MLVGGSIHCNHSIPPGEEPGVFFFIYDTLVVVVVICLFGGLIIIGWAVNKLNLQRICWKVEVI